MRITVLGGFVFVLLAAPVSVSAATPEDIARAVDRGVSYLKSHQNADGTWDFANLKGDTGHPVGVSALAGLALLESGVPPTDLVIRRAAHVVRFGLADQVETYDICVAIMFIDRLGDQDDKPLIEAATRRLLAGQTQDGGWWYTCPITGGADEIRRLRKLARQKTGDDRDLAGSEAQNGLLLNNTGFKRVILGSDNSITQFATLALWVARRHDLKAEDAKIERAFSAVERHFRNTQNPDGGWSYMSFQHFSTASMTCAGLLGLGVGHGFTVLRSRNTMPSSNSGSTPTGGLGDFGKDAVVRKGFLYLGNIFVPALDAGDPAEAAAAMLGQPPPGRFPGRGAGRFPPARAGRPIPEGNIVGNDLGSEYYFLWSLERVAVVYGLQTIGNKDWYAVGSSYLLQQQSGDGSWAGKALGSNVDTCFALFFLRRANVAHDLTALLNGKVRDPGVVSLKSGKGPSQEANAPARKWEQAAPPSNGPSRAPNADQPAMARAADRPAPPKLAAPEPTLPSVERTPEKRPLPQPSARTEQDPERQAHDLARIRQQLITSAPSVQESLLQQLRDGKGAEYTETLASVIPRLRGEMKSKARDALAERLTRMTVNTLRDKLSEDNVEIRSAAALACGMKDEKSFVPDLIPMLRDSEELVARAAHLALKALTQQDFKRSSERWRDWWQKNGGR